MFQQKEPNSGARLALKPSPPSTAESQSMLVDELLEKCRQLQRQDEDDDMSLMTSYIRHDSGSNESEMDAGQLTAARNTHSQPQTSPLHPQTEQNTLQQAIERVLRKNSTQITEQTYRRLLDRTAKRLQRQQAPDEEVGEEVAGALLADIQQRLTSLIKYACLNEQSTWQELDSEDVASYLVLSEVSLKSQVEKKRLMYVSNYLFDRLSQHRTKLKELVKQHEHQQNSWWAEKHKLTSQLASVRDKLRHTNGSTAEQKDRLRLRMQQLSEKDLDNQRRLASMINRFQELNNQVERLRKELSQARDELREEKGVASRGRQELSKSQEIIQSLAAWQLKQVEKTRQLQANSALLQELLKRATQNKSKTAPAQESTLAANALEKLEGQLLQQKQAVRLLEERNSNLQTLIRQQKKELSQHQSDKSAMNTRFLQLQRECQGREADLLNITRIHEQSERVRLELQKDLETKQASYRERIASDGFTVSELNEQLRVVKAQLVNYQDRASQLEAGLIEKQAAVRQLTSQALQADKAAQESFRNFEQSIRQFEERVKCACQQNQKLQFLCKSQQARMQMSQHQTDLAKQEITRAHSEILSLKELNHDLQEQIKHLEEDYEVISDGPHDESKQLFSQLEYERMDKQVIELKEEVTALRKADNVLRLELVETNRSLNSTSDQLHQTHRRLEETQAALSRSQQYLDQLHSKDKQIIKPETPQKQPTSDGIERQVVINFLLNLLNSELPLNNRINTIRTMAKALRMKPEEVSLILKHSERSFMQFSVRSQPKPSPDKKVEVPMHQRLYDFFQQSEEDD